MLVGYWLIIWLIEMGICTGLQAGVEPIGKPTPPG